MNQIQLIEIVGMRERKIEAAPSVLASSASRKFLTLFCMFACSSAALAQVKESSKVGTQIFEEAGACVGRSMWKGFGLPNGSLGCAASVSNVLESAGVKYARSPVTKYMRSKLLSGRIPSKEFVVRAGEPGGINDAKLKAVAKPGDVLVAFMDPPPAFNIGPKAHCGIIGKNGQVYTNDWNDGIWKKASIHRYFDNYKYVRVIRLDP